MAAEDGFELGTKAVQAPNIEGLVYNISSGWVCFLDALSAQIGNLGHGHMARYTLQPTAIGKMHITEAYPGQVTILWWFGIQHCNQMRWSP